MAKTNFHWCPDCRDQMNSGFQELCPEGPCHSLDFCKRPFVKQAGVKDQ